MNLNIVACISLLTGVISLIIITLDIFLGNKQKMMIMNFVWPLTALYAGLLALFAYYTIGRKTTAKKMDQQDKHYIHKKPFWQSVATGALHCGSGCTLGDICAEIFLLFVPITLFGSALYGTWMIDFVFAFIIGIIFQYYAIQPMRNLSFKDGLKAALKADTLSLTAWQVGMYSTMAIADFVVFQRKLEASEIIFWFVMQIAMIVGFITAFPVNWLLLKKGIKEVM